MNKLQKSIDAFLHNQQKCVSEFLSNSKDISELVNILIKIRDNKNSIFTMGNGGSGSTSSHFVSDLIKTCIVKEKNRFRAISLVDNISVILAWSNDDDFNNIFVEQLKNYLKKDDLLIGFSGSGSSKNIVNAFRYGKKIGALCVGFTGASGGKIKNLCDVLIQVPSNDMLTIESQHVVICHCLVNALRNTGVPLFKYE